MKENVYFGTYTKVESKGIYRAVLEQETGQLTDVECLMQAENPSYLQVYGDKMVAIAGQNGQGGILLADSDRQVLARHLEDGPNPCYISYDGKRQLIYTANYHKATVSVYQINHQELNLVDRVQLTGSGPHPNQTQSHPHFAQLSPDDVLIVCDLGGDAILSYCVSDEGQLKEIGRYQARAGAGPRHLVFHPRDKTVYLFNELDAKIDVLFYDGAGQFDYFQTIDTLPEDFKGDNAGAAIRITKDGKFVYVSNRGYDAITAFEVLRDGSLKWLADYPSHGHLPRDFSFNQTETFLLVGHQDTSNVTVFKRDENTGELTLLSKDTTVPEVICLAFEQ